MLRFQPVRFGKRLRSMLKVDVRRMLRSRLFYILLACALVIPIVMTVILTMMDGTVSVDPRTGVETVLEGPDSTWQAIGTLPDAPADAMDVMSLCNINMMFMLVCVFVCLFICEDFRSGFAKNLFTVRAQKGDYVVSKLLCGFFCGAGMLMAYFAGALLGGAISGLSFDLGSMTPTNIALCMVSKICLMPVYVSIFTVISVAAKKAWLAICGSLGGGMLLFMTAGMITPLNATALHVLLCLAGSILFTLGLGAAGNRILKKSSLV